jgi:hypothetical protein
MHEMVVEKLSCPPVDTLTAVGEMVTWFKVGVDTETVITVLAPTVVPESVALTNRPTVPAVLPAANESLLPEPLRVPSALLDRPQVYEMVPGQVPLHVGVAVKDCDFPAATEGEVGLTATDVRVTTVAVTVIVAVPIFVVPLSVAFTKRLPVQATVPAVTITELPDGVSVPRAEFETAHK